MVLATAVKMEKSLGELGVAGLLHPLQTDQDNSFITFSNPGHQYLPLAGKSPIPMAKVLHSLGFSHSYASYLGQWNLTLKILSQI